MIFTLVIITAAVSALGTWSAFVLWIMEERRISGAPARYDKWALLTSNLVEAAVVTGVLLAVPIRYLPRRDRALAKPGPAVLLVPGWGLGPGPLFLLARQLRRHGHVVHIASYRGRVADYDAQARWLKKRIVYGTTQLGVDYYHVVTHADAGLAARAMARLEIPDALLGNLITVACPHSGTAVAHLLRATRWGQLRPQSPYLKRLDALRPWSPSRHVANLISSTDTIVFPSADAEWNEAFNVKINLVGHFSLLQSKRARDLILENLQFNAPSSA